jgi:hypothetical protein
VQAKNWDYWLEFCSKARQDPYLVNCLKPVQQQLLIGFAAPVRRGYYGQGAQVNAQTPETALRHVAQTLVLAGYPDPQWSYGSKTLTCLSPGSSAATRQPIPLRNRNLPSL